MSPILTIIVPHVSYKTLEGEIFHKGLVVSLIPPIWVFRMRNIQLIYIILLFFCISWLITIGEYIWGPQQSLEKLNKVLVVYKDNDIKILKFVSFCWFCSKLYFRSINVSNLQFLFIYFSILSSGLLKLLSFVFWFIKILKFGKNYHFYPIKLQKM